MSFGALGTLLSEECLFESESLLLDKLMLGRMQCHSCWTSAIHICLADNNSVLVMFECQYHIL